MSTDRSGTVALSRRELLTSSESLDVKPPGMCTFEKCREIVKIVSAEPVLFLYMLGTFTQYSIFQDLVYQKTCSYHFNATVCLDLTNSSNKPALDLVQQEASHWILASTAALTVPSIFVANILGSFSDLYDRKWPLIFPPTGMVLAVVIYILMASYDEIPVSMIILASFVSGMFGGFVSVISGVTSYISAVSSEESRTMRVALMEAGSFLGGTLGPFIGGGIFQASKSHTSVFLFILACYVLAVVYVVLCVPSVRSASSAEGGRNDYTRLFSCHQFKSSIATVIRPRPEHRRRNLILLLICALYTMTITAGEMDIAYLFVKDAELNWSYDMYSYYSGLRFGVQTLVLVALSPAVRYFAISDGVVALVGLLSRIAGMILHGFATTTALMFSVPIVAMLGTFCVTSIRSMLSKQVDQDELGQLFAIVASVENLCVLLGSVIFNSIYPLTRHIFRGFTFELAAVLLVGPLIILSYLEYQWRRRPSRPAAEFLPTNTAARDSVSSSSSNISQSTVTTQILGEA